MDRMEEYRIGVVIGDEGHVSVYVDDDRLFHMPAETLEAILAEIEDVVWSEHDIRDDYTGEDDA